MGVFLIDLTNDNHCIRCNWWNWRPTLELIRQLGLIDDERLTLLGSNSGAELTAEEAHQVADFLNEQVLPGLNAMDRIRLDGTVTDQPDDGTFYTDLAEQDNNYSAGTAWLTEFAAFCRNSEGFSVY